MFLPRRGGIELHVADLAARLRGAGHTVDVITPSPGPAARGVRRLVLPLLPAAAVTIDPRLFARLDDAFDDGRYDVVHCHASVFSPAAWAAAWTAHRRGVPAVVTFHSVLRSSARYVGAAHRLLGARRWRLDVTGVSTLVAAQARRAAPRTRGAGSVGGGRELRLACAMRLTRKKRPEALVRATAALRDALAGDGVRVRLTLAGEGPERASLERLVAATGLGDAVQLPGWRPRAELRALYHASDAFVLPTRDEAFGIAALEARAAGLPVVAWRGTGVADFVRDGRHGHLCASDDDMVDRLAALARDRPALAALRAAARAEPPAAYDWSAVIARHEAAYAAAGAVPDGEIPHAIRHASEPRRRAAGRGR